MVFNHVYQKMTSSLIAEMRNNIYKLEHNIRLLESTLNYGEEEEEVNENDI